MCHLRQCVIRLGINGMRKSAMKLAQRRELRRFTKPMWRALASVIQFDHFIADDLAAAETLSRHGNPQVQNRMIIY
jgi:hypothetical protein